MRKLLLLFSLFFTSLHAQHLTYTVPYWLDYDELLSVAKANQIDTLSYLAIIWQESGVSLNPLLRGHHCWWSAKSDSIPNGSDRGSRYERAWVDKYGYLWITHHNPDCEAGRGQIKISTGRSRCPQYNIFTHWGNIRCLAKMLAEDTRRCGELCAIKQQNGSGIGADIYKEEILAEMERITIVARGDFP